MLAAVVFCHKEEFANDEELFMSSRADVDFGLIFVACSAELLMSTCLEGK